MTTRARADRTARERKDRERDGRRVSYTLDVPLHAEYDANTGVLVIETPIFEAGPPPGQTTLRLSFSAVAAGTFARLLGALEAEGYALEEHTSTIILQ